MIRKRYSNWQLIRDYLITAIVAIVFALLVRSFVIEAYRIPNSSMIPTLLAGDTLFVSKWPFEIFHNYQPKRGDVILLSSSSDPTLSKSFFIKRILGLSGDEISIKKGKWILNKKPLKHSLSASSSPTKNLHCYTEEVNGHSLVNYSICEDETFEEDFGPIRVPSDSVFVLGDFRSKSTINLKKKKNWGIFPVSSISGKPLWIWLSVEPNTSYSWGFFHLPKIRMERIFKEIK